MTLKSDYLEIVGRITDTVSGLRIIFSVSRNVFSVMSTVLVLNRGHLSAASIFVRIGGQREKAKAKACVPC